jgi:3-phosphoshikimate 1-carboxyvinyltransferase
MRHIRPSGISGRIEAPPSKSMTLRAVLAAAHAKGESILTRPSLCDDAIAAMNVAEALGAKVEKGEKEARITGGGGPVGDVLDCGESGACMRMTAALAALRGKEFKLTGSGTLVSRPVGMVVGPLTALGAECRTNNGNPPILVKGPINGGTILVDGSESSQFVSGLLMALPLCDGDSTLVARELKSKAYVRMTQCLLSEFGVDIEPDLSFSIFTIKGGQSYQACNYPVEGDWSGAAFMLVAGAIAGEVEVDNLHEDFQPDQAVTDVLRGAGAKVQSLRGSVKAGAGRLRAFEFDATHSPDLFPPLVALACACEGKSVIHGTKRLTHKESDRAAALVDGFNGLGAKITPAANRMEIVGTKLAGGVLDPRKDHRIAMAGAVAALISEKGVDILDEGCVSKSFPRFFETLEGLMR